VIADIFGPRAGNHVEICDMLASEGFFVVMPDLHRGDLLTDVTNLKLRDEWFARHPYAKLEKDIEAIAIPLFSEKKVTKIGALGFCYGSWPLMKFAAHGKLKAVASPHPSHARLSARTGETPEDLASAVKCPVMLLTAGNDAAEMKPGGSDEKIIKAKFPTSYFEEFKAMQHGWVARGEWREKEDIYLEAQRALVLIVNFLKSNL